jgi:drug/metabolite transporter (DMT)-like permease
MRPRAITATAAAACTAALAVLYNFSPAQYSFYPRCPVYSMTHLLCPGCGATRALYWLLHGEVREALHYNAMFTAATPFLMAWAAVCCYQALRYDRFPHLAIPRSAVAVMGVAVVLFAIARNTVFSF